MNLKAGRASRLPQGRQRKPRVGFADPGRRDDCCNLSPMAVHGRWSGLKKHGASHESCKSRREETLTSPDLDAPQVGSCSSRRVSGSKRNILSPNRRSDQMGNGKTARFHRTISDWQMRTSFHKLRQMAIKIQGDQQPMEKPLAASHG